jgi:hypothetical protein
MQYSLPGAKVIGSGGEIPGMIRIWEVFASVISFGAMQIAAGFPFNTNKWNPQVGNPVRVKATIGPDVSRTGSARFWIRIST